MVCRLVYRYEKLRLRKYGNTPTEYDKPIIAGIMILFNHNSCYVYLIRILEIYILVHNTV